MIQEGSAQIVSSIPEPGKAVSKQLKVFYNPVMKRNRDVTMAILDCCGKTDMCIADPMAGSGVRVVRILKEVGKDKIKRLCANDLSENSIVALKKNLELNHITEDAVEITNKDANIFLLESNGFDYIDIDPFGTPNPFLDTAITRLSRDGILAVTATDTSSLAGAFPKTCRRKYWATSNNDAEKHENATRILIRKVQMMGTHHEKALLPIYSFATDHYVRVFFRCTKSRTRCDELWNSWGMRNDVGPMWLGQLWDKELAKKVNAWCTNVADKVIERITKEAQLDVVGFYDIHDIAKKLKLPHNPKFDDIIKKVRAKGHLIEKTHFSKYGLKTDMAEKGFIELLRTTQSPKSL